MDRMIMIWLVLLVILVVVEAISLGLTTIWFAAGAAAALLIAILGLHPGIQVAVFVVVSIVMLVFTRPWAMKHLNSRTVKTNAESIVGKRVRVTADISNLKEEGQVVVNGLEWTARSAEDTVTFQKGEWVTVVGIEGVKLIVKGEQA